MMNSFKSLKSVLAAGLLATACVSQGPATQSKLDSRTDSLISQLYAPYVETLGVSIDEIAGEDVDETIAVLEVLSSSNFVRHNRTEMITDMHEQLNAKLLQEQNLTRQRLSELMIDGILYRQWFSKYIPKEHVQLRAEGKLRHVGIKIGFLGKSIMVTDVIPGSSADKTGLKKGDFIERIDGIQARKLPEKQRTNWMRGKPDSPLALEIKRRGYEENIQLSVKRDLQNLPSIAIHKTHSIPYVQIFSFDETSFTSLAGFIRELHNEETEFSKDSAIVLDLRNSSGGTPEMLQQISDLFLPPSHFIASFTNRADSFKLETQDQFYVANGLLLLLDETTSDLSEVFAASMKDNKRADLIGGATAGISGYGITMITSEGAVIELGGYRLTRWDGKDIYAKIQPTHKVKKDYSFHTDPLLSKAIEMSSDLKSWKP